MRAALRTLGRRVRETWDAAGARLPVVAATWLVRREYLVTVRGVDPGRAAPLLSGVRWSRIEDPAQFVVGPSPLVRERAETLRHVDEGQECWVAWIDGQPAHWRWETSRTTYLPYLGRALCPQPGDVCVVDVYTAPRFRGLGLHTEGTFLALERAKARGLTRLVGLVAWWNAPARRVMEVKTARTVVGSVGYWSLGAARRYFASGRVWLESDRIVVSPGCPENARAPAPRTALRSGDR